jgi:hypothetical protein
MKTQHYILIVLVGLLMLPACQGSSGTPVASVIEPQPLVTSSIVKTALPVEPTDKPVEPIKSPPPEKTSQSGQKMALLSQADLSKRLNISLDEIDIKAVQPVVWPDSSLGCPQPDFAYSQVVTNGFIVVLEVAPDEFLYHTDDASMVVFCPNPTVLPEFPVTPSDIQDGKPWMPVN